MSELEGSSPEATLCQILDWDSTFFGFQIARIVASRLASEQILKINKWCDELGVRCLYFLCDMADMESTRVAESNGYHLVDLRITLERSLVDVKLDPQPDRPGNGITSRTARISDIADLEQIARTSHRDSRFYIDGKFPRGLCNELYAQWIRRSIESNYADVVFVAEMSPNTVPLGYVSCQIKQETRIGKISLLGVAKHAQNNGIGRLLVARALTWFATQGILTASVVTQGRNYSAQRLYQHSGFVTQSIMLWYHKWYSEP